MASTMEANELILFDRVPGIVNWGELPRSGLTGATHHNIAGTGADEFLYQPGYKVGYFDRINQGPSICAYLQYNAGSVTLAAGHLCAFETGQTTWYSVTNDGDNGIVGTFAAVALSTLTDTYWGWFWVGGVAPAEQVAALAPAQTQVIDTDGNVVIGGVDIVDLATPDTLGFGTVASNGDQAVGYALAADD